MTRYDEGIDERLALGREHMLQCGEIVRKLRLGPQITEVTRRLLSTQATASWLGVTPFASAWAFSFLAISNDSRRHS
jgi:hypothetical protein